MTYDGGRAISYQICSCRVVRLRYSLANCPSSCSLEIASGISLQRPIDSSNSSLMTFTMVRFFDVCLLKAARSNVICSKNDMGVFPRWGSVARCHQGRHTLFDVNMTVLDLWEVVAHIRANHYFNAIPRPDCMNLFPPSGLLFTTMGHFFHHIRFQ